MGESTSGHDLFNRLVDEFAERYRKGERPSLSEYTDKYPELASQIGELFPALVVIERFGTGADQATGSVTRGPNAVARVPEQLGDYRILREIARGGMGVVYEAIQESLGRHVALKILPHYRQADPNQLVRFNREARAAAMLHHTNIVPVFGVGEHEGVHYYAMQYIQGQSLDAVLREVKRLRGGSPAAPAPASGHDSAVAAGVALELVSGRFAPRGEVPGEIEPRATSPAADQANNSPATDLGTSSGASASASSILGRSGSSYSRSVARIGVQAAEALAYAHHQKVLHRDIKPSNLLLDVQGTVWVTDFGLAKAEGTDALTQTGDIVGTLRYMAPERFRGEADARSDIYALGLTLYEMLTLEPAFQAGQRPRLIEQILHDDPPRPRQLDLLICRDLETVVLKAMAKEPADRYRTASELAEDLRRYLTDRPILARRPSLLDRAAKWVRRRPGIAASAVAMLLLTVVGLAISNALVARERNRAVLLQRQAEQRSRSVISAVATMETEALGKPLDRLEPWTRKFIEQVVIILENSFHESGNDFDSRLECAQFHRRMGAIQEILGREEAAEAHYRLGVPLWEALAREFPDNPTCVVGPVACLMKLGNVLHKRNPWSHEQCYRRALVLSEQLVDRFPEIRENIWYLVDCLWVRGAILNNMNRRAEAEVHYRRALSTLLQHIPVHPREGPVGGVNGKLSQICDGLDFTLTAAGRWNEIDRVYGDALTFVESLGPVRVEVRPTLQNGWAWSLVTRPDVQPRDLGRAVELAQRAAELTSRSDARAWLTLGFVLAQAGDQQGADEALRQGIALAGDDAKLLNGLAWSIVSDRQLHIRHIRQPRWAVRLAREATERSPKTSWIWNTLGVAHYRAGNWSDALEALRRSNELGGKSNLASNGYFLAMANQRLGEFEPARIWFDVAGRWHRRSAPASEQAQRFRAEAQGVLGLGAEADQGHGKEPSDDVTLGHLILQADPAAVWARALLGEEGGGGDPTAAPAHAAPSPNGPEAFAGENLRKKKG